MSKIPVPGQPVILFAEECDHSALREENQDAILHVHIALGDLMIVADGQGEHAGGATASRMVVENFYAHLAARPQDYPAESALREAAAHANESIMAAARAPDSPHERMGSTVVVALVQQSEAGPNAWIGHVGDSRAYLSRAGRLHRLTTDHSVTQSLLNRNLISPDEAQDHPDAALLSRCLGYQSEVEIEIEQHPFAVGDTLLLCSDGLWRFVSEQEIEKTLGTPGLPVEAAAHHLLEQALAAGGHDNFGIEMARLVQPPDVIPPRVENAIALKVVLTMLLLAIVTVCVLAYLVFGN
jgi:protein phosphatase